MHKLCCWRIQFGRKFQLIHHQVSSSLSATFCAGTVLPPASTLARDCLSSSTKSSRNSSPSSGSPIISESVCMTTSCTSSLNSLIVKSATFVAPAGTFEEVIFQCLSSNKKSSRGLVLPCRYSLYPSAICFCISGSWSSNQSSISSMSIIPAMGIPFFPG